LALDEYLEQHPGQNQKIVLVAFGAGFTWGSVLLTT
jgi:3-oxoacyl-[acyl-carrier-protein] synthase III